MKKQVRNRRLLKQTVLAVPAAAMMLGASSQAAQIGLNFQVGFPDYASYSGRPVTATAFGIDPTNWFNLTASSAYDPSDLTQTITLPDGGTAVVSWTAKNAWQVGFDFFYDENGNPATLPGNDEVFWGYLDDTSPGYSVTIKGLRGFASDYTIQTIASSDNATAFSNVQLTASTGGQSINYTNDPSQFNQMGGGAWGTSTVSTAYVTLTGNDSITLKSATRNGSTRSTLAGIILTYTPGFNPPLVEKNPQSPTNLLFAAQPFGLTAAASGSGPLYYQWRKDGVNLAGATDTAYNNPSASAADSGAYDVVVTNAYGAVTSAVATVTVMNVAQPVITQGPVSQTRYAGYTAVLSAQATGGMLSYQWSKGGTPIPGAVTSTLTLSNLSATNTDTYSVTVSNPVGTASASATLTVKTPAPGSYEAAVAASAPLVYYRLDEPGPVLKDTAANAGSLGAAGTGLYLSGAVHPVAGALAAGGSTGAYFAGDGGRVTVPYAPELNPAAFTVETWFKPDLELLSTDTKGALSCGNLGGANRDGWVLYQTGNGWSFRLFNLNGTTAAAIANGGTTVVPGNWYHVAATFDGTAATIYVNGVAYDSVVPASYVPGTTAPLTVGVRSDGSFWWQGAADEVALYSSALSPAQILAHYQNGTNAAPGTPYASLIAADHPVEYLRLNEGAFSLTKAQNLGTLGYARDGSFTSDNTSASGDLGISLGAAGPRPTAFPGFENTNTGLQLSNGYVKVDPLNLGTNTVTYVCWLKRDATQPGDLGGLVFERNGSEASGLHMMPDGELRYHWNGNNWDWSSGLYVPAGQWTFAALVVESSKATIYMDSGSGLVSAVHTVSHPAVPFTGVVHVGHDPYGGLRYFAGTIDEAAVYGRALTSDQIAMLDLQGNGQPVLVQLTPGGVVQDTKPSGTPHHGFNHGATWVDSNSDPYSQTRAGTVQFSAAEGDQITIPADPDFNSTTGTIMFWVRANAPLPVAGSEGSILMDRRTTVGDVIILYETGSIFVQAKGSNNITANTFAAGYVPDDAWHHIAYVYDQSLGGSISIYIDGVLNGSNPNTTNWYWPAAQQIELGRSHDAYWKKFEGSLDDFRIYNRVLTDAEIADAYSNGSLVDASALKVRYNFDTPGIGQSVLWQYGTLETSPTLGPAAVWTPVTNATSPYPFLPTGPAQFFRAHVQ